MTPNEIEDEKLRTPADARDHYQASRRESLCPSGAVPCSPSYRPFSNGCEFMDWHAYNCEQCTKGPALDLQGPNELCDIENAFALASVCGGTINDEVIGDESERPLVRQGETLAHPRKPLPGVLSNSSAERRAHVRGLINT